MQSHPQLLSKLLLPASRYTVSYSRTHSQQFVYILTGSLTVQEIAGQTVLLQDPVFAVNQPTGHQAGLTLNSSVVVCPKTLAAYSQAACTFIVAFPGNLPLSGTLAATISTADNSSTATAAAVPYDFSAAEAVDVGQNATITNWFEQGSNVIQVRQLLPF
jgi:hypothetical protein